MSCAFRRGGKDLAGIHGQFFRERLSGVCAITRPMTPPTRFPSSTPVRQRAPVPASARTDVFFLLLFFILITGDALRRHVAFVLQLPVRAGFFFVETSG